MKKILLVFLSIAFIFSGCTQDSDDDDDSLIYIMNMAGSANLIASNTSALPTTGPFRSADVSFVREISPDDTSVTLNGVAGKSIFLARLNPSQSKIHYSYIGEITALSENNNSRFAADTETGIQQISDFIPFSKGKEECFTLRLLNNEFPSENSSSSVLFDASPSGSPRNVTSVVVNYNVGDSRQIYTQTTTDGDNYQYVLKQATLRAKGTYCYVWIIDDDYTTGGLQDNKVNSEIALRYAAAFDFTYNSIRKMFGYEREEICINATGAGQWKDISTESSTGSMVNIVIYNFGEQFYAYGFFDPKDYFSTNVYDKSNSGKYLYINSIAAVKNYELTVSSMVHEFQHLVYFNKERIDSMSTLTIYKEMLSMLCEDVIFDRLGIKVSNGIFGKRLQSFNYGYLDSGTLRYNRSDGTSGQSYPNVYVFGAWLCRKYGGPALIKAMMDAVSNGNYNDSMIIEAIKAVNGSAPTMEEIFKEYMKYLFSRKSLSESRNVISGETFVLPAMDIWADDYMTGNILFRTSTGIVTLKEYYKNIVPSDFDFRGPLIMTPRFSYSLYDNYGFSLHLIATVPDSMDSIKISFNKSYASNLKQYLFIK